MTKDQATLRGWRGRNEFTQLRTAADVVTVAFRKYQMAKAAKARRKVQMLIKLGAMKSPEMQLDQGMPHPFLSSKRRGSRRDDAAVQSHADAHVILAKSSSWKGSSPMPENH